MMSTCVPDVSVRLFTFWPYTLGMTGDAVTTGHPFMSGHSAGPRREYPS
jgi:hypothetical protein